MCYIKDLVLFRLLSNVLVVSTLERERSFDVNGILRSLRALYTFSIFMP